MSKQANLFPVESPQPTTLKKQCVRCHKLCRVVVKQNPEANLFVLGTMKSGRLCGECLVVDFVQHSDIGPASAMGAEYFDHSLLQPEWRNDVGDKDHRFDPETLRQPEIQDQLRRIITAAKAEYRAELDPEEIDWAEVIANWHLPFPTTKRRKGRLRG